MGVTKIDCLYCPNVAPTYYHHASYLTQIAFAANIKLHLSCTVNWHFDSGTFLLQLKVGVGDISNVLDVSQLVPGVMYKMINEKSLLSLVSLMNKTELN